MTIIEKWQNFIHQTSIRFHCAMATPELKNSSLLEQLDGKNPSGQRASCSTLFQILYQEQLNTFVGFEVFAPTVWHVCFIIGSPLAPI